MVGTLGETAIAASEQSRRAYGKPDWRDIVHTGPDTLAGRYLRQFWHPIYVSKELVPRRPRPIRIMNEEFTLYRGESGDAHLLDARCAHRRTQLSTGWVEGDDLRCLFHGWKYNAAGQCIEQPSLPQASCEKVRIRSFPIREYLGFVFAYLGPEPVPPLRRFPRLEAEDEMAIREWSMTPHPYNIQMLLITDPSHAVWTHRDPYSTSGHVASRSIHSEETDYGIVTYDNLEDGRTVVGHFYMPNLDHGRRTDLGIDGQNGWREMFTWKVPIDDEHYMGFSLVVTHVGTEVRSRESLQPMMVQERRPGLPSKDEMVQAVLRGDLHIEEVNALYREGQIGTHTAIFIQDEVARLGIGAIPDVENERLGPRDAPQLTVRRLWRREMRALAEGRPLKHWGHITTESVAPADL